MVPSLIIQIKSRKSRMEQKGTVSRHLKMAQFLFLFPSSLCYFGKHDAAWISRFTCLGNGRSRGERLLQQRRIPFHRRISPPFLSFSLLLEFLGDRPTRILSSDVDGFE